MGIDLLLQRLDGAALGLFGAGHLGRALADALLAAGWPRAQLLMCHGGSPATRALLAAKGLADIVVPAQRLLDASKVVFYLVRPQAAAAIGGLAVPSDALLVSFLAGTDLANIPGGGRRVRAMVSDPDTLAHRNGIAALWPDDAAVQALLEALGLRVSLLPSEAGFHAFTALGSCLPIAMAYWLGRGGSIDRDGLTALARRYDLAGYDAIIDWALDVCPKTLRGAALEDYVARAATPGGITEAILAGLRDGANLPAALERGIRRGEALAKG